MNNFDSWKRAVDELFRTRYCASWAELCGDDYVLRTAHEAGDTPDKFVEWFADQYDLIRL